MSGEFERLPDWTGRAVAILAGGPSLDESDIEVVARRQVFCMHPPAPPFYEPTVIAINDCFWRAPWADVLYAADIPWWEQHPEAGDFSGLKISVDPGGKTPGENPERAKCPPETIFLKRTGKDGFDPERGAVRLGYPKQTSGYQALHLAIQLGAARVLLLGYDCRGMTGKGRDPFDFEVTVPGYRDLLVAAEARGTDVVNCTPGSSLVWFRKANLEEVL